MILFYLASPYSKFRQGHLAAAELACREAGRLIRARVPVFSPIAHSHWIAELCKMDALDHGIWLPADAPMMIAATGIIMLRAEGWEKSYGMGCELTEFRAAGKRVVWMDPGHVPGELLREFAP